ncbi:WD domain-containing protein [Westerdykella ornata]|uniref:WD repeat-containing protein JIP5 n=1 Tax=Westerdykella ornata TaxID=318751 RepID=A0A6A6J4V8_WESOR|nr:WD domain-containing protein [Westerdykella ornata]KAF2271432.1 WD domain-containing protein [Westerdykella ornata]
MFDTVCTIPLAHELFAQAIHPREPVVSAGLSSGHVYTYRLPPAASDQEDGDAAAASGSGFGHIDTAWRTRRHKGSCRTLAFGHDGAHLYSAGTDGIVKQADVRTGQVTAKIAIPLESRTGSIDPPTVLHALTPQALILGTDSSAMHVYDLRALRPSELSIKPQHTYHPHDDYVSSITPLPPGEASTSGLPKQWVSVGGTTLAVTDVRRGVMVRSENQEEELLSSVMVTGLSKRGTNVGEKLIVGGGSGVLTLWERGVWDDQDERIIVDRSPGGGESIDSLSLLPQGVGPGGKIVVAGLGNGELKFVKIGPNKTVSELKHDELQAEAVVGLGFDVTGRMFSGGGKMIKAWHEKLEEDATEEEEQAAGTKRTLDPDSDDDSDEEAGESSDEERESKKRKKRKRSKGKQKGNGIVGFSGLD